MTYKPLHPSNLDLLLAAQESAIQQGRTGEALHVLSRIVRGKPSLPRKLYARIANLLRRSGGAETALRLLYDVVRPSARKRNDSTDEERLEYAASLIVLGAEDEALHLLKTVDAREVPEAHLHQGIAHFGKWNYSAAVPYLEAFAKNPKTLPYRKLVGEVNLLACFVQLHRRVDAETLANQLMKKLTTSDRKLLRGNVLELMAQIKIQTHDWKSAQEHLTEASQLHSDHTSLDALYIKKWNAVLRLHKEGWNSKTRRRFLEVQRMAVAFHHGDTLRSLDLEKAIATKNESLLTQVYFGTPWEGFREQVERAALQHQLKIEKSFECPIPTTATLTKSLRRTIDPASLGLKPGQTLDRLFHALLSDSYRTFSMVSLFARVYPTQHFNPLTSRNLMYQQFRRLQAVFEQHQLDIHIRTEKDQVRWSSHSPISFLLKTESSLGTHALPAVEKFNFLQLQKLKKTRFKTREVADHLGMSLRSAQTLMTSLCNLGMCERQGTARATYYKMKQEPTEQAE